eukprot:TRINITY_DN1536_c0_g1_i1.p1 TRINITY_DN1536_c0_g1~~TRINITY_DN1536_c0_g1_i1.p1  ORF type:complete len:454 (+),score=102.53 TRINITY_DN1536_c0_g1_i1:77-1363(+)
MKRTARVTFVGVTSLPSDKAYALRDALQAVVTDIADIHAACDDPKMKVDEKFKKLRNLTALETQVDKLDELTKAQVDICAGDASLHSQLNTIHARVRQAAQTVKSLFHQQKAEAQMKTEIAQQVVDNLLCIVQDVISILRDADRFVVSRIIQMAGMVQRAANEVANAKDVSSLMTAAQTCSLSSIDLAKLVTKRAAVIDDTKAKADLEQSLSTIQTEMPSLLSSHHGRVTGGGSGSPQALSALEGACSTIIRTMQVQPEFAVNFDVDYLDDELGHKLAALARSVGDGDRMGVAKNSRELDNLVKGFLKTPVFHNPTPQIQEAKDQIEGAIAPALQFAKDAVVIKQAHPDPPQERGRDEAPPFTPPPPEFFEKERKMHDALRKVRDGVAAAGGYSVTPRTTEKRTISLIQAAHALSLNMGNLLGSINPY